MTLSNRLETLSVKTALVKRGAAVVLAVAFGLVAQTSSAHAYTLQAASGQTVPAYTSGGSISCANGTISINPGTLWTQTPNDQAQILFRYALGQWNGSSWPEYDNRYDLEPANFSNRALSFPNLPHGAYTMTLLVYYYPFGYANMSISNPAGVSVFKSTPFDFKSGSFVYNTVAYCIV
jgi:hypothetical protein